MVRSEKVQGEKEEEEPESEETPPKLDAISELNEYTFTPAALAKMKAEQEKMAQSSANQSPTSDTANDL